MEIRKVLALRGPNIWANFSVLECWVDLQQFKDSPSNSLPGFVDRLKAWLPTMIEHRCGLGYRGGFFERLDTGTYMGHILEHVSLELQGLAGIEVGYGKARETSEQGVYKVVVEYQDEEVGRHAVKEAHQLLLAAVDDRPFNVEESVERIRTLRNQVTLGPSTRSIVDAAVKRGIPVRRLNTDSFVQFGFGGKQRRIMAAETDRTSAIAQEVAQDKHLTNQMLREIGIPVPSGRPVESAEEAWEAAEDIGLPVVVKPQDGNQGRGVALNLSTKEQVLAAYEAASKESKRVLVETFSPGGDYRLLVVGDRMVAAARREPAHVIGDGVHNVSELVAIANKDPRRGDHHATSLSKMYLDAVSLSVLREESLYPTSVPAAGRKVFIRRNANLSTGGTAVDVTDQVHPETAARVVEAAQMIGLEIAGLDVVCNDISQPLESQNGVIVEINAAPGLRMHLSPSEGEPRPVGEAIVDMMFPHGENGRIPVVAITGVNGKTTTTRFIAHIFRGTGKTVGLTSTDGIFVDDRRIDTGDCSGPKSARAILANPKVDYAVLETARGGILREGLGFDRCQVAVVTNIGEGDHLGLSDINTLEQLAKVKRCIVDVVAPDGFAVLNAADPHVAAMAPKCPGNVLFFDVDENNPIIVEHRKNGGRAVFVRDKFIVLATGRHEISIVNVERVPLTNGGRIGFHIENTLAAIAAAWSVGIPAELIRLRAESFQANLDLNPGRFNIVEINNTTMVIDYGHNISAVQALISSLEHFPQKQRLVVYSTAGDRRDADLIRQGELLGDHFDRVILYEGDYVRGRQPGDITRLLKEGMKNAKRATEIISGKNAIEATEHALKICQPGELLVLQADVVDETVQCLRANYTMTPAAMPAPAPQHSASRTRV
jgi:cyanophycin synthetase